MELWVSGLPERPATSLAQAGHLPIAVASHPIVAEIRDQFRFLNRQLVLPVSMMSQ